MLPQSFAVAVAGLAGLTLVARAWLHYPALPHPHYLSVHDWIGVLQLVFASVAGAGALVALIVAYRRQRIAEADSAHDRIRVFNERFIAIAAQLGDDQAAVRLAGIHAMGGLADDWEDNRQTVVDVLCAYLRMPYEPDAGARNRAADRLEFLAHQQVRHTAIRIIAAHLRRGANVSWRGLNFDFTAVHFDGGDFTGAVFSGGRVSFESTVFSGGRVSFEGVEFSGASVTFDQARFSGGEVSFGGAEFSHGRVSFEGAEFSGGKVDFGSAKFSDGRFSDATVSFTRAKFSGGRVNFEFAKFSWDVNFIGAKFSGGEVGFRGAEFSRGRMNFALAEFSGGTVDLAQSGSVSRFDFRFDFEGTPPKGLYLPQHRRSGAPN